ncbi:hypothetical protein N7463_000880 [Penicillium fimorum]|uniref:Uncharacterized protein n=1 Tax=Penicillium fimorum TaxID=1882269 RepID=A0A9W9Y563_9EURO|nr:hypothetical protein N7463_000880 [Penicillium fimorum]
MSPSLQNLDVDELPSDQNHPINWVPVADEPLYTPRKLRVVCVGAGFSGLLVAYKFKHQYKLDGLIDLAIYEKNADVGGTWLENKYPGVACDIPAHIYTFPFEPNPNWSTFYAEGSEILQYIKDTSDKYKLHEMVQLNSEVTESIWDEDTGKWNVKIQRGNDVTRDTADILINGSGILNGVGPTSRGFKGKLIHSASWDTSLDWSGKNVALIGNGSSAIQILPTIQPTAKSVTNFMRSPTWVAANFAAEFTKNGKNFSYTEEEKRRFQENPDELLEMRKKIEHGVNQFFYGLMKGSPQQKEANRVSKQIMEDRLNNNPELCDRLIPDFEFGCRRISPGEGYLEALQENNVVCCFSPIHKITNQGIETEEGHTEFDIIICATGFDVSFSPFWKLVGRGGQSLSKLWQEKPDAYFGICAPEQPNYFIFNGPNCPIAHGSLLAAMESTADWIFKWCKKIASEDIKSVCVKRDAVEEFNIYTQEFLKRTRKISTFPPEDRVGHSHGPFL